MLVWLRSKGDVCRVGIESTGGYGAGISRHLARAGTPCSRSSVRFVPAQSFVFEADSTRIVITSVSWYWLWRTDEA